MVFDRHRQIRASPTYADDARVGHFLHPGQVLVVDDRRMVTLAWKKVSDVFFQTVWRSTGHTESLCHTSFLDLVILRI